MFPTLIADTVDADGGGDRGLMLAAALVALALVVAGLRRRGGDAETDEETDAIDRIEVSGDDEHASTDTAAGGIDRVGDDDSGGTDDVDDGGAAEERAVDDGDGDDGDGDGDDDTDDDGVTVDVTDTASRFGGVDAVDWVMVLAAGVRAMREELEERRTD